MNPDLQTTLVSLGPPFVVLIALAVRSVILDARERRHTVARVCEKTLREFHTNPHNHIP